MKNSYFLKSLLEILIKLPGGFRRESWYRKTLRMGGHDPDKLYQGLYRLQRKGVINFSGDKITLGKNGTAWLAKHQPNYFHAQVAKKHWDKKWRIVIFDIPKQFHSRRSIFQKKLKYFDFYALQKSVFVFPYPCAEQLAPLAERYQLSEYIDVLLASELGAKEEIVKKHYGL